MHLHITLNTYWTPLQLASIIECYESLASPVGSPMLYHAFTTMQTIWHGLLGFMVVVMKFSATIMRVSAFRKPECSSN